MSRMLTNASAKDRHPTDLYETPDDATDALLAYLSLPVGTIIWEPASGGGKMVRRLRGHGYKVCASTIESGQCFFSTRPDNAFDWIITNPPFKLAAQFIRRASSFGVPFAFLLKSQFWHAASRLPLFNESKPSAVLPLTFRPDFLFGIKGGAPTMDCLWTVWGLGQPCRFSPLVRPRTKDQSHE